jgi:Zn-dependent protease
MQAELKALPSLSIFTRICAANLGKLLPLMRKLLHISSLSDTTSKEWKFAKYLSLSISYIICYVIFLASRKSVSELAHYVLLSEQQCAVSSALGFGVGGCSWIHRFYNPATVWFPSRWNHDPIGIRLDFHSLDHEDDEDKS